MVERVTDETGRVASFAGGARSRGIERSNSCSSLSRSTLLGCLARCRKS